MLQQKEIRLFIILAGFFITNAIVAEFIGVKIFALEETLGFSPLNWNLFGHQGSLMLTAGVLLWPIVFIMTDVINEYYGRKGVQFLSYFTAVLIGYGFFMVFGAIELVPAGWWVNSYQNQGVPDAQAAFSTIFGQGLWIIIGSLVAFLIGQVVDAFVFYKVKVMTGQDKVWFRATASTAVSQLIDSFVVLYIAFVLGPAQWEISLFLAVGLVNYAYKLGVAIILIPALYAVHAIIDRYLGKELSDQLRGSALKE